MSKRTLRHLHELDALPIGTVVVDQLGEAMTKVRGGWRESVSDRVMGIVAPVTVIYDPSDRRDQ